MKYQSVFFDVGGVLMHTERARVAHEYVTLARARGVTLDPALALRTFSALDDEIPVRARAAPPLSLDDRAGEIFWKTLFADGWSRLGLGRDDAAINHLYTFFRRGDFNVVFDDVRPALDALRTRGVSLGIVSNFTTNLEQVLHTLGISDYFAVLAVSALVRAEKPDHAIFDYAARGIKQKSSELLFVGDSIHADVDGARNAGWNAILLDRDNWYPNYTATSRIRRLTELVDKI